MSKSRTPIISGFAGLLTIICMASPAYAYVPSTEVPTGGFVHGGNSVATISISSSGYGMNKTVTETIKQNAQGALIDWNTFNIGSKGTVQFNQPTNGVAVNRVRGGASEIYGKLNANATVILVNQAGINFKNGSTVNVGKLIATTSTISESDFNNGMSSGTFAFTKGNNAKAQIINEGKITAADGGLVALVAPVVKNNGIITAKMGKVQLGSGDAYSVDLYGDGLLNLQASDDIKNQLVENSGAILANGGEVLMTAAAARNVVDSLINMDGLIEADTVGEHQGKVVLKAEGGAVNVRGTISAENDDAGEVGGEIEIKGLRPSGYAKNGVTFDGANVKAGSGSITVVGNGTQDARYGSQNNSGVKVANGSVLKTTGAGTISVTGVGGNGGYTDYNIGVVITGDDTKISTDRGNLTINGTGGGADWSAQAHGIYVSNDAEITSNSGTISLYGVAGGGCNCSYENWGIGIDDAKVATHSGNIVIAGFGGALGVSGSTDNYGVYISNRGEVTSQSGAINITGVGGGDKTAANRNYGILATRDAVIGTHLSHYGHSPLDTGTIRFVADTLEMDNSVEIATTNTVFFEPYTDSTTIGVGGGAGTLQIDDTVLDDIKNAGHITIGNTTRDTGLMTVNSYDWQADVSLLNKDGNININGEQKARKGNKYSFDFLAWTANGDITIGRYGSVSSDANGTPIVLAASNGIFTNNSYKRGDALDVNRGARWLVYSGGPLTDTYNGLEADFHRFSCTYGGMCTPTIPSSGDGFIYSVTPVLTVAANDEKILVGDAAPLYSIKSATETYTFKGVTYDLIGTEYSHVGNVTLASPYVQGDSQGTYPINPMDASAAEIGYTFNPIAGTLTVSSVDPRNLLERWKGLGKRGPNGILLAIVNTNEAPVGNLADLAPAAGGDNPQRLADLAPKAGGNTGITPLVQCDQNTPCDINQ